MRFGCLRVGGEGGWGGFLLCPTFLSMIGAPESASSRDFQVEEREMKAIFTYALLAGMLTILLSGCVVSTPGGDYDCTYSAPNGGVVTVNCSKIERSVLP